MNLQDIPSLYVDESSKDRARFGDGWPVFSWNRGQFLRAAAGTAVGVGLASLGVFPPARRALASHIGTNGYEIKPLPCAALQGPDTCSVPCSPSTIYPNACFTDSSNHYVGYHRHGCSLAYTRAWRLRQNQCVKDVPTWDGWNWSEPSCGGCGTAVFRCHDGYNCQTGHNCDLSFCDTSICKWRISCN
jgi:hypothetical protein